VETRGRFVVGRSLSQRPKEVCFRASLGHGELDTVLSGRGKSKGCVATFIERKTRGYTTISMPDRTARSMEMAFDAVASSYPAGVFQTATTDRGKEFAWYAKLEATHGVTIDFADPYSSWQRGSNENTKGLLREFFPKGTDFSQVHDAPLAHALHRINHRPRKCLGWRTAHESFAGELSHLT